MWPWCIEKDAYIAWVNTLYFRVFFIMSLPPLFCFMVHRHVHIPHFFLSFFFLTFIVLLLLLLYYFLHSKVQFSRWWIVHFSSYMCVICLLSACTFHCLPLLHVNSSRNLINGGKVSFFMCHVFLWILKLDMLILNTHFLYRWIPSSSVGLKTQLNWIWLATAHFR